MKTKDLSIKELAAYFGVSTDTIRRAARAGNCHSPVPAQRTGSICAGSEPRWNGMRIK
jgi:hypothetical protein